MKKILIDWLTKKISQDDIRRFCEQHATTTKERVLIVHSDDMAYDYCFPNRVKANVEQLPDVTVQAEKHYYTINDKDNTYDVVVCTGLLEHVPDPKKTLNELWRVLAPEGRVLVSASSCFSLHNSPNNYFQFLEPGMKELFSPLQWSTISITPSCKPFRTIAILLQRICYQTDMNKLLKLGIFLLAKVVPWFDVFIKTSYGDIQKDVRVQSMLYSNIQVVAKKIV